MYKIILFLFPLLMMSAMLTGQVPAEINKAKLLELTKKDNDTTYVVNFWATWCSPCVKEIGYFEELHRWSDGKEISVILISLDFPDRARDKLLPFLEEKSITAPVFVMTDLDYNNWIDKVDPSWSGALPATLIFKKNQRVFLEQELTKEELYQYVKQISN